MYPSFYSSSIAFQEQKPFPSLSYLAGIKHRPPRTSSSSGCQCGEPPGPISSSPPPTWPLEAPASLLLRPSPAEPPAPPRPRSATAPFHGARARGLSGMCQRLHELGDATPPLLLLAALAGALGSLRRRALRPPAVVGADSTAVSGRHRRGATWPLPGGRIRIQQPRGRFDRVFR